jgi:hypothetical protein
MQVLMDTAPRQLHHIIKKPRGWMAITAVRIVSSIQSTVALNIVFHSFQNAVQFIPSNFEKQLLFTLLVFYHGIFDIEY